MEKLNLFRFWFIVCDFRCWCGNPLDIITDSIEDIIDAGEDVVEDTVDILEESVDLLVNTTEGILNNAEMMIHGAATLDWDEFSEGSLNQIETTVYILAIASGNPWAIAAGIVALDGKYNDGELTHEIVMKAAHLETAILGTEVIADNAEYIEMAIILAGGIYAGYEGFNMLAELAGIQSYLATWKNTMDLGMGINSSYEAYQQYNYWKDYYQIKMAEYKTWINSQLAKYEQMKTQWFNLYADISNSEVLYESMPGGYFFNAGAGSDEYSISSIHEQSALILSIDTQRDIQFDRQMHDMSKIDYIKTNLNDIEPKAIRWA